MIEESKNFGTNEEGHFTYENGELAAFVPNLLEECYDRENFYNNYLKPDTIFSVFFPGTVLMVWKDKYGEINYSTRKQVNACNSFWGNKNKKFVDLFLKNGGQFFLDNIQLSEGINHCFSIIDVELITRTRLDIKNNETIIGYIGSYGLDGGIIDGTNFDESVFYNHIPSSIEDIIPEKEKLEGKILLPIILDPENSMYILERGYSSVFENNNILDVNHRPYSFLGECIIARNKDTVIRVYPEFEYQMRDFIDGNKYNRLNILFLSMDHANDPEQYKKYIELGIVDISEIENTSDNEITEKIYNIIKYKRENDISDYDSGNKDHRRLNILTNFLIFCPLTQVRNFINHWKDYQDCRKMICNFLQKHNSDVRHGKYDERLDEYHERAHRRLKDLALRSYNYSKDRNNKGRFHEKLEEKLKELLINEYGSSLYRIRKAVLSLRD